MDSIPIIQSLLDTDLYKISMGQIVAAQYPDVQAKYEWIDRDGTKFPKGFADRLREQIQMLAEIRLTDQEADYLKSLRWIRPPHVDLLRGYRFDPNEIQIIDHGETFSLVSEGPWYRNIMWEVPLMAIISELYFRLSNQNTLSESEWVQNTRQKGCDLIALDAFYADFGTRRRYSFDVQLKTVSTHTDVSKRNFIGTSNVYLAMLYGIPSIGTQAHEWVSAHAALYGYRMANLMALQQWSDFYEGDLGIALPDTFTTQNFFQNFGLKFAKLFDGIRHDSGDPIQFADNAIRHYQSLGIEPMSKTVVFSDGLTVDRVRAIQFHCKGLIKTAFGIGTNLTNDVGARPLNMVIKMTGLKIRPRMPWLPVIKLSDVPGKHTGDVKAIRHCKRELGLDDDQTVVSKTGER